MTETEQRDLVCREAMTWLGTPYHHQARVRGAGVDCAMFPAAVYEAAGVMPHVEPKYSREWHLHRGEELYIEWALKYAAEVDEASVGPGDFVVWRWGRTYSHGAIILDWPQVIHSYIRIGVTLDDANQHEELRTRPRRFFSPWRR